MAINSEAHAVTRQLFMWSMACVYMFAFISLYTQIPGLYGSRGLTPVHNVLPKLQADVPLWEQLGQFPSLLIFHPLLQIPPSVAMELCCLVGGALALLMMVFRALRCTIMFALLWLFYLSLHKVGQVFLWFQWDSLLLEAGFIAILVAPFNLFYWRKAGTSCSDGVTFWLVRFLLFRLMFAAGVVKLTSQCPTWWGLTALNYHYETQCIPTPVSWYAHQLPEWFQRLSIVGVYVIEIVTPLLFFLPLRSLRLLAFWAQVLLQVLIIITGNYNFFNLLTIALSLSLVDDRFLGYGVRGVERTVCGPFLHTMFGGNGSLVGSAVKKLLLISVSGLILALSVFYFDISIDYKNWTVLSNINFSSKGYSVTLSVMVMLTAVMAAMSLAVEVVNAFIESLSKPGLFNKLCSLFNTTFFSGVTVAMFSVALVSHGVLDTHFQKSLPQNVVTLHNWMDQVSVTSPYGLFRRMTGVGGRPEVIIEGNNENSETGNWKEYEFLYKPGNLREPPVFVAPHQPRLDWQMWFAALGHYSDNPWLVNLAYKLLVGEEDVLRLMATPPFSSPPKYIRARLYHYHFTPYDTSRPINNQTKNWWQRELSSEYLYALSKDNEKLHQYLSGYNYLKEPDMSHLKSPLLPWLAHVREMSEQLSPPLLLWCLFLLGLTLLLASSLLCPDRGHTPQARTRVDITEYLAEMQATDDEDAVKDSPSPKAKRGPYRRHGNKAGKH